MAKKPTNTGTVNNTVTISAINRTIVRIVLVGDSPLICHKWSEKAKRAMLEKQQKKARQAREEKDPQKDYEQSLYPMPDGKGYGFPSVAFKSAAVGACRFVADIPMTVARGAFHVMGDRTRVEGEPRMREDMVRVGMGTADIRYRAEFPTWRAELMLDWNTAAMSIEQLVNLFNVAGFGVGVGEWRPEKNGQYGRFHVEAGETRA